MAEDSLINDLKNIITQQKSEIFKLKSIIDGIPGSVYWKNIDGKYLGRNLYSALLSRKLKVNEDILCIIGKTDHDLLPKEIADQYRKNDIFVIETGKELITEEIVTTPDNEIITQLSTKCPLYDESRNIIGVIGNTVDISNLKKVESDLQHANEQLKLSNKIRDDFIHNMEHDIRTPFVGILGLTKHLFEQEEDKTKKEYLNDIAMSAKQLLNYCNSILDYSKIEMDSIPIIQKKFELKDFIENLIITEKPAAIHKNLILTYEHDNKIPRIIISDQFRLQRIFINLISNAIKFTHSGKVTVQSTLLKANARDIIVSITIKDTGIGIPEDKINYIYEKFYRNSPSNKGLFSGLGLGLKVVKTFMEDLDGEVEVKNNQSKGTTFRCTLPFKLPLIEEFLYD